MAAVYVSNQLNVNNKSLEVRAIPDDLIFIKTWLEYRLRFHYGVIETTLSWDARSMGWYPALFT